MNKTIQKLVGSALLAALSVVFARLLIPMPNAFTRFSIEAVPIFLAGMLYGPLFGGMVGFVADAVGTLFSGFGYNPLLCLAPVFYGLCGGFLRLLLRKRVSLWRIAVGYLPPVLLGSVLWQSLPLAVFYGSQETLWQSYLYFLSTRGIQFAVTYPVDVILTALLCRSNLFYRLGYLPTWSFRKARGENLE